MSEDLAKEFDHVFVSVTHIVMRSGVTNESTIAIIEAVVLEEIREAAKFKAALQEAITWWMLNTKEGAETAKRTGYDFNIGDYPNFCTKDVILRTKLHAVGIAQLEVTVISSDESGEWVFDDHLFDDELVKPK
jgi:hypothetical protein